ncbi:pectate lyase [Croceibacterium sp. TMG7-5b_MA50]|uniref:pectate lyase n=1 Tax=Croceibacterium sp. TMG7-5b_MA50 TaxID=3121290 RepID=UPI003221DB95
MRIAAISILLASATMTVPLAAKVIGTNVPATELSAERIAELPAGERAEWQAYLERSQRQLAADRASLVAELPAGATPPPAPEPYGAGPKSMPMDRETAWYAGDEARRIADTVVSFQTPAGGWSKNQNRAGPPRLPGQRYSASAGSATSNPGNFDEPVDRNWTYVGTLDNGATTAEMRYLAKVAAAVPGATGEPYRNSFVQGVRYLLAAQYPNGGWPQVWPLQGGYHDGITFNDNAVAQAAMLLDEVARDPQFAFVPTELRTQAAGAVERGMAAILAAQVRVDGKLTGWPQQVDALTMAPMSARNYEMRSIAAGETTDVVMFLMNQPDPSPEVRAAVDGAIAWLRDKAVNDVAFTRVEGEGRKLIPQPGAGPLWSRNYDIVTGQPIFGDRDKSIHDDVNGISEGRRNGYAWWVGQPAEALAAYPAWQQRVGVANGG